MAVPHKLVTEALGLPDDEREALVLALLDSFSDEDEGCDLPADELAELDAALADVDRGEMISADELLAQMRQIQ